MHESLKKGEIVGTGFTDTLSDGTAGDMEPNSITFDLCRACVDRSITVPEEDIYSSVKLAHKELGIKIEGAAGVAVAGWLFEKEKVKDKEVAVIICGGNIADEKFNKIIGVEN